MPRHLLQSVSLTWSDTVPAGTKVHWRMVDARTARARWRSAKALPNECTLRVGSTMVFPCRSAASPSPWPRCTRTMASMSMAEANLFYRSNRSRICRWSGMALSMWTLRKSRRCSVRCLPPIPTVTVINIADLLDTVARRRPPGHDDCPLPRGVLHPCRAGDPRLQRGQHPLPSHPRGGRVEDARSASRPRSCGLRRRIHRARACSRDASE